MWGRRRVSAERQKDSRRSRAVILQPGRLAGMAGKESSQVEWLVVAAGEERFRTEVGFIQRSGGDCPLLWLDRWSEAGGKRASLAAEVPSPIGEKYLVEDKSGKGACVNRAEPDEIRGLESHRGCEGKRELGVSL